jgi:hypothetical protein
MNVRAYSVSIATQRAAAASRVDRSQIMRIQVHRHLYHSFRSTTVEFWNYNSSRSISKCLEALFNGPLLAVPAMSVNAIRWTLLI